MNQAIPQPSSEPPAGRPRADSTPPAGQPPPSAGGGWAREITISALVTTFWRGIWLFLAVVMVFVLATVIALKLRQPLYVASMTIAPAAVDFTAASQLAGELEQFAGLAILGQGAVKIERVSDLERYAQLFGSIALAERLQAEHQLLQTVFAGEWDPERQEWRPPSGLAARLEQAVLGFFSYRTWSEPNVERLAEWLGGHIDISRFGGSSLLRIEMSDPRRAFAVSMIELAHRAADDLLRDGALEQVESQIRQLESELAEATTPRRRRVLEAVLADQYGAQALLRADQPYAAQVVVPAAAASMPTTMNPILALTLAAVVGAIVGLFAVFLRDALRSAAP